MEEVGFEPRFTWLQSVGPCISHFTSLGGNHRTVYQWVHGLVGETRQVLMRLHRVCCLFWFIKIQHFWKVYCSVKFVSCVTMSVKIQNTSIAPKSFLVPLYGQPLPQPPAASNHPSDFYHFGFAFSRISYKCNHTASNLLYLFFKKLRIILWDLSKLLHGWTFGLFPVFLVIDICVKVFVWM